MKAHQAVYIHGLWRCVGSETRPPYWTRAFSSTWVNFWPLVTKCSIAMVGETVALEVVRSVAAAIRSSQPKNLHLLGHRFSKVALPQTMICDRAANPGKLSSPNIGHRWTISRWLNERVRLIRENNSFKPLWAGCTLTELGLWGHPQVNPSLLCVIIGFFVMHCCTSEDVSYKTFLLVLPYYQIILFTLLWLLKYDYKINGFLFCIIW